MTPADLFAESGIKDKLKLKETVNTLVRLMDDWAQEYPFLRTVRIPPLAFHNAVIMPHVDVSESLLLAKLTLWIFGIDDVIDERMVPLKRLEEITEQWCLIACDHCCTVVDDGDELSTMLLDIKGELSTYPAFDVLRQCWATHVCRLIQAGRQQYQYALQYSASGPGALPTLDEYLGNGMYSIGVPLWASTLAVVLGDPWIEQNWESVNQLVEHTSASVRLYNDFQSFDKEMQEGNVNAILIVYHSMRAKTENPSEDDRETMLSQAKQQIWQLANGYRDRCYGLASERRSTSGQFEDTLRRMVAFHEFFYRKQDYNNTSMADVTQFFVTPTEA
jgi:hypothetical protein